MMRALRVCLVVLGFVLAACTTPDPTGDTDPTDRNGGGGWEGSNCMGAAYGITLLDEFDQLVTVRQSFAIGVVADAVVLSTQVNTDGGLEVVVSGLDRFLAVGLRNWLHKIGETLLPDEDWVASYDPDNDEYGRGHYDLIGLIGECQAAIDGPLPPAVARTLAMFLYALSQMASCPDPEVAEADGNFVAVPVRLQATEELVAQLPAPPPAPTLSELLVSQAVREVPTGQSPDPRVTCILWQYTYEDTFEVSADQGRASSPGDSPTGATYRVSSVPRRCLLESQVEAVITTVPRSHPTFESGPAGEPVAFSATPVVETTTALGAAAPVRRFLRDNHVGTIEEIESFTRCDDPSYAPYGSQSNACPPALTRFHFAGAQVQRRQGELPSDLESALAPIFDSRSVRDAIIVIVPFNAQPRCMQECPPESPAPEGGTCE